MKEAIGGLSLFQIIIIFLLVFVAIMCLTINYSKAYGVKDEVINIIESDKLKYANADGSNKNYYLQDKTIQDIKDALNEVGYRDRGNCPTDDGKTYIAYNRKGEKLSSNKDASFCIAVVNVSDTFNEDAQKICGSGSDSKCTVIKDDSVYPNMVYYEVVLFYHLDIPFIKTILNFNVKGSTKVMFGCRHNNDICRVGEG